MMIWFIYLFIVLGVAGAMFIASKRKQVFVEETRYTPPSSILREDFHGILEPTVVIAFTSKVCDSCKDIVSKVEVLRSKEVGVEIVEFEDLQGKKVHAKYQIDAVPTTLIVDNAGKVFESFVGPVSATDLWASVAKARGVQVQSCSDH